MVFQLQDNNNNFSGKSFDWDANKSFFKNLADKVFIAPTSEQLSLLKQYNDLTGKAPEIQKEFLSTLDDKDPLKTYFTTLDGGIATQKGMAGALNKTTLASKAATLGMKGLSVAGNMIVMWAISAAIGAVVEKLGEAKKASEDAAAAIGDLNNEIKSLDDLKKSMLELRTELDKGNLSHGDAYDKRLELMKIQDTLIEKYGSEAKGIDFVTGSIKEQEQAIDDLARAEERKWKQENQSAVNDAKNYLTKKSDGKMTFEDQWNSLKGDKTFDFLKSQVESLGGELKKNMQFILATGGKEHITTSIEFNGTTVDKQIEKYQELFDVLEEYKRTSGINVDSELGEISNKIKALKNETYTNHKAVFDKYTEIEVNSNELYRNIYAKALKAKEEYNEAILNGADDTEVSAAMSKMKQAEKEFLDAGISDVGVSDYFQSFFDKFKIEASKHEFKINIKANKDGLDTDIKQALSDLSGLDNKGILNIGQIEGTAEQEAAFALLSEKAEEYGAKVEDLIEWLVELGLVQGRISDANQAPIFSHIIDPATESFKNLNTQLDSIQSAYKTFASAIDEYNQTGTLSLDTTQAILALGDDYIGYLFDENNQLQLNKEGFIALANAKLDKLEADALAAAMDNVKALTDEATATEYLKGKTEDATTATKQNTIAELENLAVKKAAEGGNLKVATEQIIATFSQYKSVIDSTRAGLGSYTDAAMGAASASDKLSDALRTEGDAAIRVIDRKIKAIQDAQKASEKAIDEEIDGIKKEKEAYEKAIDAEIDKLSERKKALEDSIDEYESAAGAVKDLIDEQMDAIDKRKDEVNEFYDEQLDALDKTNEALQDQIDREKALEALEKAKSQKVMVFKDGEFDYLENEGAVKDAQDNYDQVLADQALQAEKDRLQEERDAKLEALDAEKKLLEDYKKLWEDATTAYEREQQELINIKVFGKDWEQAILEQRTDILHKFTEEQYNQTVELEENVLTQLEILTKQKEDEAILFEERIAQKELEREQEAADYAARIETLNGYKDQVQEGLNLVGQSWEEYQDTLKYEAKWEAALLDGMAEKAWEYAESVKAAIRSAQDAIEDGNTSGGSGKSPNSSSKDKSLAQAKKEYSDAVTQHAPQSVLDRYKDKIDNLQKLSTGGVVTEPGLFITDEDGAEVKVRPKDGKATLLDKGDMVFPHGAFPTDPFSLMMRVAAENSMIPGRIQEFGDSVGKVINNTTVNQKEEVQLHFHGDMSFPNITDPNDSKRLVRALLDMGRESYQLNSDGGML